MADLLDASQVSIRTATADDRFLVRRWLSDPNVQLLRGSAASAQAQTTLAMGTGAAMPRIIERDGVPVGYAHEVEIGVWAEQRPDGVPAGAWDTDCFLAPPAKEAVKLASAALALLSEEVFATTLAVACTAMVPIRSEPAVRAYEQAGFRWQRIWHDPLAGPSWLLLKERPGPLPTR